MNWGHIRANWGKNPVVKHLTCACYPQPHPRHPTTSLSPLTEGKRRSSCVNDVLRPAGPRIRKTGPAYLPDPSLFHAGRGVEAHPAWSEEHGAVSSRASYYRGTATKAWHIPYKAPTTTELPVLYGNNPQPGLTRCCRPGVSSPRKEFKKCKTRNYWDTTSKLMVPWISSWSLTSTEYLPVDFTKPLVMSMLCLSSSGPPAATTA